MSSDGQSLFPSPVIDFSAVVCSVLLSAGVAPVWLFKISRVRVCSLSNVFSSDKNCRKRLQMKLPKTVETNQKSEPSERIWDSLPPNQTQDQFAVAGPNWNVQGAFCVRCVCLRALSCPCHLYRCFRVLPLCYVVMPVVCLLLILPSNMFRYVLNTTTLRASVLSVCLSVTVPSVWTVHTERVVEKSVTAGMCPPRMLLCALCDRYDDHSTALVERSSHDYPTHI